ncbi:MAG: hypothetical protein NC822_05035 [Candidatus Omnitrophica bacterium]|nr:hypothetical protein [Candidatus Omnitrophota bacterium]MCM8826845.1 hypothetical protein [Candidatus Omnitrophota bacterium]
MHLLIETYNQLKNIILLQKKALKEEDFYNLEKLTKEKDLLLKKILDAEESLDIEEKNSLKEEIKDTLENIIKEDREFNSLLRLKKVDITKQIEELKDTRKNLSKIVSIYGKKFKDSYYLDRES